VTYKSNPSGIQEKKQRWKQLQCKTWTDPDYSWLIVELEKAWSALEFIRDELGVPQPGYPAPVANAAERARKALEE
jgi:hypothetical protein